ncbi:MAG TPA: methionine--tRNA ligase, partial [Patescibacteria group bacterium]
MKKTFYITTTLPYVNAEPHIGFALEIIEADVQARFNRQIGNETFFNTGTDEHGLKIYRKAQELGVSPQEYVDQQAKHFLDLKKLLNLSFDNFIRTTDVRHIKAAQEFWCRCEANGDIYKKIYKVKYCVGCELEKSESDLIDGKCPVHPNLELEIIEEENYFFRFSKFQKTLLDLYKNNPDFVIPNFRFNEIKAFVERGLEDFSVSRLKDKMPWGIEVPNDPKHTMYVWFDALVNYVSAIGWPDETKKFNGWWPVVQFAGKDNLRQQSAMWQAMLMSAKIKPSKQIFINGFINVEGRKMSK